MRSVMLWRCWGLGALADALNAVRVYDYFDKIIDNIKSMWYDIIMEEIKENAEDPTEKLGRGGRRAGAGRPRLELHQERERAVTRSITLTAEEWELLRLHSKSRSYSKAVSAALDLALNPRSAPADWCHSPNIWAGPGPVSASEASRKKSKL